jgi:16S rRNA (adenine1518-N6/adenine1519-N6)-dimethyltransferase
MNPFYFSNLNSSKKLLSYVSQYQFFPKKKLGQNFLIDQNITKIIVKALSLDNNESVFEIGTGLGALTGELLCSAQHVFSIEKDLRLQPILDDLFQNKKDRLTIIYEDILEFDLKSFLQDKRKEGYQIEKIAGNLPYFISLPLLRKLMDLHRFLQVAVIMIQKEVAERMMAKPGDKNYGLLSVVSQYYSQIKKIHQVKPDVFYPKPEVNSMIIRINFLNNPSIQVEDEKLFFEVVRAVFQHRRKNIYNSLKFYFGEKIEKGRLEESLKKSGLDKNKRGEKYGLQEFALLSREIKKIIKL